MPTLFRILMEHVDTVTNNNLKTSVVERFPKAFTGVGKLKDFQLRIPIDETVELVIQPIRRIPYNLREKLDRIQFTEHFSLI
jgi:hypothetical protein